MFNDWLASVGTLQLLLIFVFYAAIKKYGVLLLYHRHSNSEELNWNVF